MSDWIVVPSEHFSDFFPRNDECLGKVTRDIFNVYMYLGPVEIHNITWELWPQYVRKYTYAKHDDICIYML